MNSPMRTRRVLLAVLLLLTLWAASTGAQTLDPDATRAMADRNKDLTFPSEPREPSLFARTSNVIWRPAGSGPFPAVVIHHSCGGIRAEIWDWASRAVREGYVVMVLDSLGPRGVKLNCTPPTAVSIQRGVKDAFQALEHLQKLPAVDPKRVVHLGFSWGAMVGELASSAEVASILSAGPRFAAVASAYPICHLPASKTFPNDFDFLRHDVDTPLLLLLGEDDTEAPVKFCTPQLEALKAKSAPVEWHVYPNTTHCWDCSSMDNFRKTDFQGNSVVYRYSADTTEDSAKRIFEFFARALAHTQK
ncbi:dienelactone hydrolase family protein [Ramlibacter ginsenosidimutans]|uniref:Dienelactone hydrolase family protein n=1 Tax=Ramlibacter ginsenosidimutans TaxID=502333 RepID=A0A934TSL0_9BURK|nr:dienelactone hydrolase family protein [Ramlibacter ginsenosidimutans]MBK6006583.1 dienelactone hydrolase family protein [Ramlibacter ginsenosidimutans]